MSWPVLIHSFNTRPLAIDCYGIGGVRRLLGNIWYFSLSVAYARSLGARIELHTDTLGERLLGHLPYDAVHLTLDGMPRDISPRFWAAGKIAALEAATPGTLHIDGDVFIKKPQVLDAIAGSDADVVVQHSEIDVESYPREAALFAPVAGACAAAGIDLADIGHAFNTGIVAVRSERLLRRWCAAYKAMARAFTAHYGAAASEQLTHATPDLITEQLALRQLAGHEGCRVFELTGEHTYDSAHVGAMGYQHVPTMFKYDHVDKVKNILRHRFPQIYNKTLKLCQI